MLKKSHILFVLFFFLPVVSFVALGEDDSKLSREYKIKAAFLYNFIQFVDWPEDKEGSEDDPIIIGILGQDPFGDAFEPVAGKQIKGRKSLIKRIEGIKKLKKTDEPSNSEIESLRKCHLLFICSSEKDNLADIINLVNGQGVLTVGETSNMLKSGGMINFIVEENKVRFEINLSAVKQGKLKIRSQLLRLAKKVVEEKESKDEMS
ncbi:MAG: YfiR family protein [Sedimentisphaerales bacterium]|nr:YfiR family protein [Sedimentisphaerales bacterium]